MGLRSGKTHELNLGVGGTDDFCIYVEMGKTVGDSV